VSTVVVEGLSKTYGSRRKPVTAVQSLDLTVEEGERLVLLGPSGCGKTTLLRCLAGLERPTTGRIELGGTTVFDASSRTSAPPNHRDIGMVFQGFALWPHLTVAKNVAYPLVARRMKDAVQAGRVDEVLDAVHCLELRDRYPGQLSGGQQQRVALARALASKPALLLLDEPLSNLDALLRADLRLWLREVHRELGYTGIYVTHDQLEAFQLGTRVAVMQAGRLEQVGRPADVYARPSTAEIANFLGIRNRLALTPDGSGWATAAGPIRGSLARNGGLDGSKVEAFLRPEDVRLVATEGRADLASSNGTLSFGPGVVSDVLLAGSQVEYIIDFGGVDVLASGPRDDVSHRSGDEVFVCAESTSVLLYADGRLA
jgi:iron(III) transport system ATP-binding protein